MFNIKLKIKLKNKTKYSNKTKTKTQASTVMMIAGRTYGSFQDFETALNASMYSQYIIEKSDKTKTGQIKMKVYRCPEYKQGCEAYFRLCLKTAGSNNGKYMVTRLTTEHKHEAGKTPRKIRKKAVNSPGSVESSPLSGYNDEAANTVSSPESSSIEDSQSILMPQQNAESPTLLSQSSDLDFETPDHTITLLDEEYERDFLNQIDFFKPRGEFDMEVSEWLDHITFASQQSCGLCGLALVNLFYFFGVYFSVNVAVKLELGQRFGCHGDFLQF